MFDQWVPDESAGPTWAERMARFAARVRRAPSTPVSGPDSWPDLTPDPLVDPVAGPLSGPLSDPAAHWSGTFGAIRRGDHNDHLIAHGLVLLAAGAAVAVIAMTPAGAAGGSAGSAGALGLLHRTGGDLGDKGMKILAGLNPSAALIAERLAPLPPAPEFRAPDVPGEDLPTPPRLELPGGLTAEQAKLINDAIPIASVANPAARPFVMAQADLIDATRAVDCMTAAIYFEAASEPLEGQRAIAQVVLNRVRHPAFPKSVCGVVFQGSNRSTGCQFTFACDGSINRRPLADAWQRAREVAVAALNGYVAKKVGNATHYHADYVAPYWSTSLIKVAKIGAHIFYRWTGGSGEARSFSASYIGAEAPLMPSAGLDPRLSVLLGDGFGSGTTGLTLKANAPASAPAASSSSPALEAAQRQASLDASPTGAQAEAQDDPAAAQPTAPAPKKPVAPARGHWDRLPVPRSTW